MKRVYTNSSVIDVNAMKSYLESNNIACVVRNEFASSAMGEVPFFEVWPELWIRNEGEYEKAVSLLSDLQQEPRNTKEWLCQQCNETNPGNFDICWQCGEGVSH